MKQRQKQFQSTHPSRDATKPSGWQVGDLLFQSTHPSRDATIFEKVGISINEYFNPRIPHGMRLHPHHGEVGADNISIHASLTGCDKARIEKQSFKFYFNPRIPHGMRQYSIGSHGRIGSKNFNPRIPHGMRHMFLKT